MTIKIAATAALTAFAIATAAHAAPACHDTGDANVTEMSFNAKDPTVTKGLNIALQLALEPGTFPAEDIAKNKDACLRGEFVVGSERWQIWGDDKDTPSRWAVNDRTQRVVFLAIVPDPAQAAAWFDKYQKDNNTPAQFSDRLLAIVVADGDRRTVYQFSRVIPDDYHLSRRMKAALTGTTPPTATMDIKTGEVSLGVLDTNSLADIKAFKEADGTYFFAQADGSARHPPSGLDCPAQIGGFVRKEMRVINPAEHGLDVSCHYYAEKSWFSVFDTRYRGNTLDKVFSDYVRDGHANAPVDHDLPAPGAVSTALPIKSAFWQATDGSRQGVWVAAQGDWYVELRVTYAAGDEAKVTAFVQTMLDRLARPS
ncbi:MAG TPA: hypothetical protein VGL66_01145 [Caulobacteraceae bacterium]|jgi:hypothetical protein